MVVLDIGNVLLMQLVSDPFISLLYYLPSYWWIGDLVVHLNSEYPAWQHVFLVSQIMHPLNGDGSVQIHHLRFADDIVLIGKNHDEVAQMLLDIEALSIKI